MFCSLVAAVAMGPICGSDPQRAARWARAVLLVSKATLLVVRRTGVRGTRGVADSDGCTRDPKRRSEASGRGLPRSTNPHKLPHWESSVGRSFFGFGVHQGPVVVGQEIMEQ